MRIAKKTFENKQLIEVLQELRWAKTWVRIAQWVKWLLESKGCMFAGSNPMGDKCNQHQVYLFSSFLSLFLSLSAVFITFREREDFESVAGE